MLTVSVSIALYDIFEAQEELGMNYPEFLHKKGTIGFVAPSFGCNRDPYYTAFQNALKKWRRRGYRIDLGPNCFAGDGIGISSSPENCGRELTDYYCSEKNDVLISCGGGELMCETMSCVDFDRIAQAKPKWFMGFSDNTNFCFTLTTMLDVASIYGPCAATFGMNPWHPVCKDAMNILEGKKFTVYGYDGWERESLKSEENPLAPYNITEEKHLVKIPADFVDRSEDELDTVTDCDLHMEGRLIGGCLDVLTNLCGTRFDKVKEFTEKYKEEGQIWFLEACDLNALGIRRALWELSEAGWFDHVSGFLIGRPLYAVVDEAEVMGVDQYDAVLSILSKYQVPIIMDADLGHVSPSMPLINGSYATIDTEGDELRVAMELK